MPHEEHPANPDAAPDAERAAAPSRPPAPHRRSAGRRLWHAGRAAGTALLDLAFPHLCLGCTERLAPAETADGVPLCARCRRRLPRPPRDAFAERIAALPGAAGVDAAFALWGFDAGGTVQRVQHRLKYGNRPRLGVALGRLIAARWQEEGDPAPGLVVPVPLHRLRLLERGYNQAAMLADGVAAVWGVPSLPHGLDRTRRTRSQTRLGKTKRWENVAGAFSVPHPEALAGHSVLLVDDVVTTGATLLAAATALREAGAVRVRLAALALADA